MTDIHKPPLASLTEQQIADANTLFKNAKLKACRRKFLFFRKNDEGYAMFRVTAINRVYLITYRHALKKSQLKEERDWLRTWCNQPENDAIGSITLKFKATLEEITGRELRY
jgi:hypothetical protein